MVSLFDMIIPKRICELKLLHKGMRQLLDDDEIDDSLLESKEGIHLSIHGHLTG